MLDAPVAGGVIGAEAATLSVMVGGERAAFERVEPLLKAIGTKVFYCGPSGNGSIVKLCNNLCSQAQIAAAGEILSLGVKAGVDLQTLAGVIGVSTGTCRAIVETFPKQLFQRNFENPSFSTFLSAKDTHLAIELAHELGVPMEIGEIVERDKQESLRRGWGPLSPDVFVRLQEERSGVNLSLVDQPAGGRPVMTRLNGAIAALEQGKPTFVTFSPPEIGQAQAVADARYDGVVFEMEHGPYDIRVLRDCLQYMLNRKQILQSGSLAPAVTPMVRIPPNGGEHSQWIAKQVLDSGVYGVSGRT